MTEISNPHDKFFKEVFTNRDGAEEFLRHYLPENVVGLLDLDSLEYTKDTFVDMQLKEYFSDLLFRIQLKEFSEKRTGLEYIEAVLKYIVNGAPTDNINYEDLKAAVNKALPHKGGEIMPTIADTLRDQGMQQGMQQGIQQGIQQGKIQAAREAIFENLEARFEIVPRSVINRIDEIEELSLLKMLHKKSIVVNSLEQFREMLIKLME